MIIICGIIFIIVTNIMQPLEYSEYEQQQPQHIIEIKAQQPHKTNRSCKDLCDACIIALSLTLSIIAVVLSVNNSKRIDAVESPSPA